MSDSGIGLAILSSRGRIVAVEPVVECGAMIEINTVLNKLTKIEVVQAVLGSFENSGARKGDGQ